MGKTRMQLRRALPVAAIVLCAAAGPVPSRAPEEILVGQLDRGGRVLLVGSDAEGWGIRVEAPGIASVTQREPVRAKAYRSETDVTDLTARYRSIRQNYLAVLNVDGVHITRSIFLSVVSSWHVAT